MSHAFGGVWKERIAALAGCEEAHLTGRLPVPDSTARRAEQQTGSTPRSSLRGDPGSSLCGSS